MGPGVGPAFQRRPRDTLPFLLGVRDNPYNWAPLSPRVRRFGSRREGRDAQGAGRPGAMLGGGTPGEEGVLWKNSTTSTLALNVVRKWVRHGRVADAPSAVPPRYKKNVNAERREIDG
eukprot:gene8229-biopygen3114